MNQDQSSGDRMDRRGFNKLLSAAVAGMMAGGLAGAGCNGKEKSDTAEVAEKHICRGRNSCKGKGGCKTDANSCAGKNECSGKGGCATVAHHGCKGQNECKGFGGCKSGNNGCAAKNDCKGQGGCAVPLSAEMKE